MDAWGHRVLAIASVVLLLTGFASAGPAAAVEYPTWDEVQAAKGDEAATAATIGTIDTLLTGLQADAARLGDEAVARGADAAQAATALQTATGVARALQQQAEDATARAARSREQAAQIVAALYRSGGVDLTATMLLGGEDPDDLLYQLGVLDRVGEQLDEIITRATVDANQAGALREQAEIARTERDERSRAADAALATAENAAQAADAAVAQQQADLSLLYEQLAVLKNTSATLEQQFRIGQQAAADAAAKEAAARAAAEAAAEQASGGGSGGGSGSGSGGGSTGGQFEVPSSGVNDPAGAQAFAFAQLAQRGLGGDQNSCLLQLWNRESGWRTNAYNASSGAYGIAQSLPGSKMGNWAADWRTNYQTQVMWGLSYIFSRYGTPCGAWQHSQAIGWY